LEKLKDEDAVENVVIKNFEWELALESLGLQGDEGLHLHPLNVYLFILGVY
jgi:hypothetical protein